MKKLSAVLIIIIVVLSFVSGYFLYQISDLERKKSDLQNRNSEFENQIFDLESQIDECQNQTSEMKNQIDELEQQNLELQNQTLELESLIDRFTNRVNITKFSSGGFNPMVGLLISSSANVTIQNFGINDVENLTLLISSGVAEGLNPRINFDLIRAGETKIVSTHYYWYLGSTDGPTVTLKLGETILDEYTPP